VKQPLLVLIGGAPGIGKSTVAAKLNKHLENSVWLDGDDLWRMNPFTVNEDSKQMVLDNIGFVLSSFLRRPFEYVIFSWVMHEPQIVDRIQNRLADCKYKLLHLSLGCRDEILLNRIATASQPRDPKLCLARLDSTRKLYPDLIDTSELSPEDTLSLILAKLRKIKAGTSLL